MKTQIVVYGDGACSGNPGPGGWAFVMADLKNGRVVENSGFEAHTTNNRMELGALVHTLQELLKNHPNEKHVSFLWDSAYVVNGFNTWLANWVKRDFVKADGKEVSNQELWKEIWELKQKLPSFTMTQIPGHSGLPGNERVDELCVAQSKKEPLEHYVGELKKYSISAEELTTPLTPVSTSGVKSNLKYPAYLSLVEGKLVRHLTWDECKARVHGQSAKFKKVKNSTEEAITLKGWKI